MKSWTIVVIAVLAAAVVAFGFRRAEAKVRLDSIATVYGMHERQLVGVGIVTGLNGTGDSSKSAPTMRTLGQMLRLMNVPAEDLRELRNVKNVALVRIEAKVPRHGVRFGQKLDVYVTSMMDAKSLRGGRLLATPLEDSVVSKKKPIAMGIASGQIVVENSKTQTVGKIPGGLVMSRDILQQFVSREGYITVMLNRNYSSFYAANEVARAINQEFDIESKTPVAKAVSPNSIRVAIPRSYQKNPVECVGLVMSAGIEQPHTQARVIINSKTNTIVVTGEVEVSPVIVSVAGLQINTQGAVTSAAQNSSDSFAPIPDRRNPDSTKNLRDLIEAFRDLKVPTEDIIKVLRTLNRSGKLYAEFIEQ